MQSTMMKASAGSRVAVRPARRVAANAITQKPLPYAMDALEPHMSKSTFEFHYGKHHRAYVDNLNKQIAGKDWDNATLEDIVAASWNNGNPTPEFNNAGQVSGDASSRSRTSHCASQPLRASSIVHVGACLCIGHARAG
jgi:Fe-Mn family superoxide dismutase